MRRPPPPALGNVRALAADFARECLIPPDRRTAADLGLAAAGLTAVIIGVGAAVAAAPLAGLDEDSTAAVIVAGAVGFGFLIWGMCAGKSGRPLR